MRATLPPTLDASSAGWLSNEPERALRRSARCLSTYQPPAAKPPISAKGTNSLGFGCAMLCSRPSVLFAGDFDGRGGLQEEPAGFSRQLRKPYRNRQTVCVEDFAELRVDLLADHLHSEAGKG